MDYEYLFNRVKALQRELAEISEHNQQYYRTKNHSPTEKAQHQELGGAGVSNSCWPVHPEGTDGGI